MSKTFRLIVSLLFVSCIAHAQNSVLSSIGIGKLQPKGAISQQYMGGAGLALSNPLYTNHSNPSLLPNVKQFVAEVGVTGQYQTLETEKKSQSDASGDLNYFALTIPFSKTKYKWTGQFGMRPYSRIESQSKVNQPIEGTSFSAIYDVRKTGGLNSLYFANGVNVYKGLHIGLNIRYLFGALTNEQETSLFLGGTNTSIVAVNRYNVRDFTLSPSLSYVYTLKNKNNITVAFTHDVGKDLKTTQFRSIERKTVSGLTYSVDTTTSNLSGKIYLPSKTTIGMAFEKPRKWAVAADLTFQDWSTYEIFDTNPNLSSTYGFSMGGEYTPDYRSVKRGFSRMTYRGGFYYKILPYESSQKEYSDIGINFGTSIPIGVNAYATTMLHLGAGMGRRGNSDITENYMMMSIGLSMSDFLWFRQPKID